MSYSGSRLAPMFDQREIPEVCRRVAHEGGRRMTDWTKRNTPIGHRAFDPNYIPGRLRESIQQKVVVVYPGRRGMVYESGCETNVSYAPFVEEGTGLYGPYRRMYEIRPKNPDGWLSWIDQESGERIFAKRVMHPGSPGQHMFAIGAHMTEAEFEEFAGREIHRWVRERERAFGTQIPVFIGRRA